MNLAYRTNKKTFKEGDVVPLFKSVGWTMYSADRPRDLLRSIKGSSFVVSAWDKDTGELVGMITAIDNGYHVYVPYVLVNPKLQGKGIGSDMLSILHKHYEGYRVILCTDTEEGIKFYKKNGFYHEKDYSVMLLELAD